eukprot:TRINITY_DN11900_c0_g1_i1.p2 TRINITY_DN11900_c0_g1~~TRINITY_DN11900_c0_g1_i1.p2  ORF type:complete len:109 (-),score=21.70 TRINITY_DN11900_c0_g1_i1:348-674(-)
MLRSLVGSEMCIRDRYQRRVRGRYRNQTMGAQAKFNVPRVWSPAGGWWCKPTNWQRNTKVAALVIAPAVLFIFGQSINKERRYAPGTPAPYVRNFGRGENPQRVPGSA